MRSLSDGMTSIGVAIANDLFGAPWDLGMPWYSYRVCTADRSPIRIGALRVEVEPGIGALSRADTVIIPGRGLHPPPGELLAALNRAYRRGARMVSFCTGAYILAEAGLLDGRPAATLWTHADRFRARDRVRETLEWALQQLGQPLPVSVLAAHCAVSPRQFTRQFREATGTTPHQWLLTQRIALAQRLLETTEQPIDQVAASAGFGTSAAMRLQFQRWLDTSPAAYRQTFRTARTGGNPERVQAPRTLAARHGAVQDV